METGYQCLQNKNIILRDVKLGDSESDRFITIPKLVLTMPKNQSNNSPRYVPANMQYLGRGAANLLPAAALDPTFRRLQVN